MGFWNKLKTSVLGKTATQVSEGIKAALGLNAKLDDATRDALEEVLLQADVGIKAASELLKSLQGKGLPEPLTENALKAALAGLIEARLAPLAGELKLNPHGPNVILVCGVNGSGKTTTIGKLAGLWQGQGKQVMIAAADTYRAGAVQQAYVWASRAEADFVKSDTPGGDPAGVAYRAVETALKERHDVVLIDTAGRLSTRQDLMEELAKIKRVVGKLIPDAPHHVLLVLDGTQGQATLAQVREFGATAGVTGLVVTKLDGSAKAGFLLAMAAQGDEKNPLPPVHYLGYGEKADDLVPFEPESFARAVIGLEA